MQYVKFDSFFCTDENSVVTDLHNAPGQIQPEERTVHVHKRTGVPLTRKRQRDPTSWKRNIRKKKRQSGEKYVNSHGNEQAARSVKTKKDCTKCKFKCSSIVTVEDRSAIFNEFWKMSDNEKLHFYGKTTKQESRKSLKAGTASRKKNAVTYSLPVNAQNVRVCKVFYLSTLDINHKRIQFYHANTQKMCGTPTNLQWGKSANNVVLQEIKDGIREHINSLPRVESHYNRENTKKEYLAEGLNVKILYEEYVKQCSSNGITPGNIHLYRQIFNNEFNIAFHVPKKDRCEAMKIQNNPAEEDQQNFVNHLRGKKETKTERDNDRKDNNKFTVCFDLQNVFALQTAEVSNFFYKRKLNVYFMTAHCSADKRGYGALWHEEQSGRTGNDIASSVLKIL